MRNIILYFLIASQGVILLTHGQARNRFHQIFSQFTRNEHQDQQLAQLLIFVLSLLMLLILTKNIFLKMTAIIIFTIYTCFSYNVVLFQDSKNLSYFLINLIIAGLAADEAIEEYVQRGNIELQKKRIERKNSIRQEQQRQVIKELKRKLSERQQNINNEKHDHQKSHKKKHKK